MDAHKIPNPELPKAATNEAAPPPKVGPTYRDIREYLAELDRRELLIHVPRLMNKDTEVMPLARWQFRKLEQSQRKGWLFENLTDSRGRKFDGSVAVGITGASIPCLRFQVPEARGSENGSSFGPRKVESQKVMSLTAL
jgi:hypothetical protein